MILKHFVIKNWFEIREKYSITIGDPMLKVNPKHIERIYPRLWQKYGQCRLYIPLSPSTNAGYVDLVNQTVKTIPDKFATPARQMQKLLMVLNQLKTMCYVEEPLKFL